MDERSCPECAALRRQLNEAIAAEGEGESTTDQTLAAWLTEIDEDKAARVRAASPVWSTWRRLVDHRARTGHWVSVVPSAGSFESPN